MSPAQTTPGSKAEARAGELPWSRHQLWQSWIERRAARRAAARLRGPANGIC
jgi:hypothetical protein